MSLLTIYTPLGSEYLDNVINAVVGVLNTETFGSAVSIVSVFAVLVTAYQYILGKKFEAITRYFVAGFFATYVLLGIKVPVAILDMQHPDSAQSARTVDHVPIGLALPASIISTMGYGITMVFQNSFHTVDDLDFVKSGMVFGSRVFLAESAANLSPNPNLLFDMSAYLRQCVFQAKLLGSNSISPNELVHSDNLEKLYFDDPSPIYRVVLHDGTNISCIDAVGGKDKEGGSLKTRLSAFVNEELSRINKSLDKRISLGDFKTKLDTAHEYYTGIATSSAAMLTQNILINATRDAARDAFAFSGADAALMNYTNTQSMQKMHIAEANTFWLAGFRLPYYMTVIWLLTISLFPLILLLSLLPLTQNVYTYFLQSQLYLWSWPPMFVIIHYMVAIAGQVPINQSETEKIHITFSNIDVISSLHSNFAYTAGALAASVPFLAYFITKGLSFVLNNASQHFGGIAQSLSIGEAQSAASGNVSLASYSGWNMNYDNTNAHKFDTNRTHFEGMQSTQMPNGAISTITQDGSHIANVMPAISNSAVSVHGSDRVVDSLHQSANESFANASHLRTSADSHFQSGLNTLSQFSENDANDYRVGRGVSNTNTDSISEDLRKMQDSVKQFNQHHDKSAHIGMDAAIGAQFSSQDSLLGKGVALGTGLSAHGSINYKAGQAYNVSIQEFQNSSEGQAFHNAYQHMVQTAKSQHLDVSDVKSLNTQEQIAAHFSEGDALISQSSSEYTKGMQYQYAASRAKESASAIDSNLNQPFHNWVMENYGEAGERTMLQVDGQSIAKQRVWAEDFLNSQSGQNAIHQEVRSMLKTTPDDVLDAYQAEAFRLKSHSEVQKTFNESNADVHAQALDKGQRTLSPSSMEALKKQHIDPKDILNDAKNIREDSQKPIHNFKEK